MKEKKREKEKIKGRLAQGERHTKSFLAGEQGRGPSFRKSIAGFCMYGAEIQIPEKQMQRYSGAWGRRVG